MTQDTRRAKITWASEIETRAWRAEWTDVVEAARDVLPADWHVLPSGLSTAKLIANRAAERYDARIRKDTALLHSEEAT